MKITTKKYEFGARYAIHVSKITFNPIFWNIYIEFWQFTVTNMVQYVFRTQVEFVVLGIIIRVEISLYKIIVTNLLKNFIRSSV